MSNPWALLHYPTWPTSQGFHGETFTRNSHRMHLLIAKESERKRAAAKIKKQKEAENKKLEEKRKINDEKFKEWLK